MSSTMDWKRAAKMVAGFVLSGVGGRLFDYVLNLLLGMQVGMSLETMLGVIGMVAIPLGMILLVDSFLPNLKTRLRSRIWIKRFEAKIVGKEPFLLAGTIGFKASYRGKLERGLFTCKILPPSGEILPTEKKTYEYWPCYGTFQRIGNRDVGILKGSKNYEYTWQPEIPKNYPEGKYAAFVGVYESTDSGNECVKDKRLSFTVVDPNHILSGSPGTTCTISEEVRRKIIDDSRSV